jgi:hypothetical protein
VAAGEEWLRAKDNRDKLETLFMGPSKESVLFSKSSLNMSCIITTLWLRKEWTQTFWELFIGKKDSFQLQA